LVFALDNRLTSWGIISKSASLSIRYYKSHVFPLQPCWPCSPAFFL
jgi:hypothetical protein